MGEMGSQLHCQPWRTMALTAQRELPESSDVFSWFFQQTNTPAVQSRAGRMWLKDYIYLHTFFEGLFRPLKHKVKLSLFFQLASKEGGAQEGPGVFGHWAAFDGISLEPSGKVKWKARCALPGDLFLQIELVRWGQKLCFQKQGILWAPIVNQTSLYLLYKISAWPVAV